MPEPRVVIDGIQAVICESVGCADFITVVVAGRSRFSGMSRRTLHTGIGCRRAAAILAFLADHFVRAVGLVEQVENRGAVARGLGRDDFVSRIKASLPGSHRVHLEAKGENAVGAVLPVSDRTVGDVQVAGLLRRVAVGRGHRLAYSRHRIAVVLDHVGGHVGKGVAIRPHDQFAVGVEVNRDRDLLFAIDHAAVHEVAHRVRLRR